MANGVGEKDPGEITLVNVRLSFPDIFRAKTPKPDKDGNIGAPRFGASFLIPKGDTVNLPKLKAAKQAVEKAKWGNDVPKLKPEKICYRDGDLEEYDGYEGMIYVSAGSPENRPPKVVDRNPKRVLKESDGVIYAGCYVNAIIRLWAQDNTHGKRINASLEAIQFVKDGEAFGAKAVDPTTAFEDLSGEGDGEPAFGGSSSSSDDDDDLI